MKTIEVCIDPKRMPSTYDNYPDFYVALQLNKAGIPFFERSLAEGPSRGTMQATTLEGGSTLYRWTNEAAA